MAYPTSLDNIAADKVDATTSATDHPAHHDALATAVNAIEGELGLLPKGGAASVRARLDGVDTSLAAKALAADLTTETAARVAADALLAPLASPALTGNPTAPNQAAGNNTTRLANTAFVQQEIAGTTLYVPKSLVDAKGDLLVGTADNTVARKAVGSAGTGLVADPASSDGLAWGDSVNPPLASGAYYGPHGTRTAATLATQDLEVALIWLPAGAYDALMFELNTAGTATATFEPLLYDMSSGSPGAKLVSGGAQNVGTGVPTGQKIVLVSFTLTRTGWYWIGGHPLSTGTAPSLLSIGTFPTYWPSIPSTNNDSTFIRKLGQLTPPDPFGAISGYGTGGAVVRARAA